jgi:hypothetical protein
MSTDSKLQEEVTKLWEWMVHSPRFLWPADFCYKCGHAVAHQCQCSKMEYLNRIQTWQQYEQEAIQSGYKKNPLFEAPEWQQKLELLWQEYKETHKCKRKCDSCQKCQVCNSLCSCARESLLADVVDEVSYDGILCYWRSHKK